MACRTCSKGRKKNGAYIENLMLEANPMNASDIMVYDGTETRRFNSSQDWNPDRHKLILFFPETFTPVCQTEMGALNQWVSEFDKLGVDVYAATTDPIHAVKDWYEQEEALRNPQYKILSTYILPAKLNIINAGRAKRASVLIGKDGDTIVQEHFHKVGRSLKELHRTFHAYTTDSYCAEGWEDPSDGFLTHGSNSDSEE